MKSIKLLPTLLGISITINIVTLLFDSSNEETKTTIISNSSPLADDEQTRLLFEHDNEPDQIASKSQENEQFSTLKKKITILATQNKTLQLQIDKAKQKQTAIVDTLKIVLEKIDAQILTPAIAASDVQPSDYNLDFNLIPRDVVKQCMKLTSDASSNIRQQQKQSREQLLMNEAADEKWNSEIESKIQSLLTDRQLQESELVSLNCRTTICELKIQHNSPAAKKLFEGPFFSRFQQSVSQYDETFDIQTKQSTGIFYLTRNKEN